MSNCWRMFALTGTDLSIVQASSAPTTMSGIQTKAAFWYQTVDGARLARAAVICWPPPKIASARRAMS